MSDAQAPVVVGVDGSDQSRAAVPLAAREAAWRHRPLRVVHAFIWPMLRVPLEPPKNGPADGGLRQQADRILDEAMEEARAAQPGLPVSGEVVAGQPAVVLLAEARHAEMVVIGSRGLGGFTGLLLGSVAVQIVEHAPCPVLVARGEERTSGPVLVGVDGSLKSEPAIRFALEEASWRGTGVVAVHAWTHPVSVGPGDMQPLVFDINAIEEDEARALAESMAGWRERYPDVPVETRTVRGRAARALLDEAGDAQLIVVGARGRGGFTGLLLGSVSQAVLHHAPCPVALLRTG
ncbi:MAG TPA: universal stress protein [Micromonospora sp.]|nr:universal stress protein [Micromonospora sp.]